MATLRGSQVSFKHVFYNEPAPVIPITRNNGRNKEQHERRNDCLLDRYYFICRNTGKFFDAVVKIVADEFFITEFHASKVILQNNEKLVVLKQQWKNEAPEKMQKVFMKKWPHLVW